MTALSGLRRSHPRPELQRIVSYFHRGKRFLTVTLNLGLGGMKIRTPYHIPECRNLGFRLVLAGQSIRLRGKVVYSRLLSDHETVSGVQFLGLSRKAEAALRRELSGLVGSFRMAETGHTRPDERTGNDR
ncbi:MAG: PilZ domain-containing protein [Deltaproteobacteria bacterium]|nr:PilZ domain-containing protein [Deltaproteobacteria bacterium]MBW2122393.1 PilZ domain-containing protein [Deltaproteobacteria bacterium]